MVLLYEVFEHDYAYMDACSDSYSELGEYADNVAEFLAPKYGLEL